MTWIPQTPWIRQNLTIYGPLLLVLVFGAALIVKIALDSRYPQIDVADQTLVDGKVTVERAFLKSDGFIAIHESASGMRLLRSSPIGYVALNPGLSFNVEIRLTEPVTSGSTLFAVLHRDADADGRFAYGRGATDTDPIELVRGAPLAVPFAVN